MSYSFSRTVTTNDGGKVTTRTYRSGGGDAGGSGGFSMRFGGAGGQSSGRPRSGIRRGPAQPSSSSSGETPQLSGVTALNKRSVKPGPPLPSQNYEKVKQQCLSSGQLWEDPEFPASQSSLSNRAGFDNFGWQRPSELCDDPQFQVGGASRFDIKQGRLGDCWLLAAVASLTLNQELMNRVVPPNQSFSEGYCGVFVFHFWHQGEWIEVLVDDRLPTHGGQLVFLQSEEKNEFWSALLEKAYAKLVGSYENLKGGSTLEAMEDFSGGVGENFDLRKAPPNLFKIMLKAKARGSLMGCAIEADPSRLEAELANGLVMGHAYSVTGVTMIDLQTPRMSGKIPMVRVRNPWGQSEWNGAWSDQSREWSLVSESERKEMGLVNDNDGEFWMSFQDWSSNFTKLEVCNLGPDSLSEDEAAQGQKRFEAHTEHSAWVRRVNAGGCRNFLDTFWTNPQFRVTLTDPDDDEDDLCTMIVALMQKDRRKKRSEGLDLLTVGYVIYKLNDPSEGGSGPLQLDYFKYNASTAKSPSFINTREVCGRHSLPPGTYVIVPSTFDPNEEADFMVRIFTEKSNEAGEMDQQTGLVDQPAEEPAPEEAADSPQEEALRASFQRIAGVDMEIDAYEFHEILNVAFKKGNCDFAFDGFSRETARSMVAMMDVDRSGKLGFDEFKILWNKIKKWKGSFKKYDQDRSGQLSSYELRRALQQAGFRLSNETLTTLVFRYCNRSGQIGFDDYVLCAVRLAHMIELFKEYKNDSNHASFGLDDFIQMTMYS